MAAGSPTNALGMATAISIDERDPPSCCACDIDPNLAVQFISTKSSTSIAVSARNQEIFLDYVGIWASHQDVHYLLDERFHSFLGASDRRFKENLLNMLGSGDDHKECLAFQRLERFCEDELGYNKSNRYRAERTGTDPTVSNHSTLPVAPVTKSSSDHPGHVFCVNGSVCDLACDAFVCPTVFCDEESHLDYGKDAIHGNIYTQWRRRQESSYPLFTDFLPRAGDNERFRLKRYVDFPKAVSLLDWPWDWFLNGTLPASIPLLVAGQVGGHCMLNELPINEHVSELMRTLHDAMAVALQELQLNQPTPQHGRERHLIAVPVLGTGGSGGSDLTGQVVDQTLAYLHECAVQNDVDIVLVCADAATYAHAQNTRFRWWKLSKSFQSVIDSTLHEEAKRLAVLSTKRQLSLFVGAGVSVGSGLPTWFQFLEALEAELEVGGQQGGTSLGDRHNWDPLSMAEDLEQLAANEQNEHGKNVPLKERVRSLLKERARNPGLLLYLLLCLEPTSIVTQNYDNLIERAYECRSLAEMFRNESISVIPYRPLRGSSRWLLKMHGCVSSPDDIVLTASDYKSYGTGRLRALSGLVQANLMTSHFLFCGFSMKDPNYLRILDEVRHAMNPSVATHHML